MIDGLKPYPAMKDSGVPWLGEVPEHWDVQRLKHVCRLAYGDALASEVRLDGDVPVYGSNGRVGFHSLPNTRQPCLVIGRKGSFGKVNFSSVEPGMVVDFNRSGRAIGIELHRTGQGHGQGPQSGSEGSGLAPAESPRSRTSAHGVGIALANNSMQRQGASRRR